MKPKRAQVRANNIIFHAKCSLTELQNHLAHGITVLCVNMSSGESWSSSGRGKQQKLRVCGDTTVGLHSLLGWERPGGSLALLYSHSSFPAPVCSCPGLSVAMLGVLPSPDRAQYSHR